MAARAVLPKVAWVICSPDGNGKIASIETNNKLFVIDSVEFADYYLGGEIKDLSVQEQSARVRAADRYRALWLVEGIGLHYAFKALKKTETPTGLMREGCPIPREFLLLTHAGMAMAFVRHHLEGLKADSPQPQIRAAVEKIVKALNDNSADGCQRMSYEATGMVLRFFYGRAMFDTVYKEMSQMMPDQIAPMWHGVGRGLYFFRFPPKWRNAWPAFDFIEQEQRDDVSRQNMLAGLAAGVMVVNMRTPEIMEAVVRQRITKLSPADQNAWSSGIICSTILRQDFTENEGFMLDFPKHKPAADLEEAWDRIVRQPVLAALNRYYPVLLRAKDLDYICYCSPVDNHVAKLAGASRATT